jgi:hypothetical protein
MTEWSQVDINKAVVNKVEEVEEVPPDATTPPFSVRTYPRALVLVLVLPRVVFAF